MRQSVFFALLLSWLLPAQAWSATAADAIEVMNPWARETPPGMTASAGFMHLKNTSAQAHKLVAASSPQCGTVELHTHIHDNGVMRMRPVEDIPIPANGQAQLQPGGYHLMLMKLKGPLKAGESLEVTLTFEDGSQKTLTLPIKGMNMGQMKHDMQHMQHDMKHMGGMMK